MDDIIREVHKQQSKKKHHNANPLPEVICVWGWCRDRSSKETPPTFPESVPNDGISVRGASVDECQKAMETVFEAAHNVEIGDYNFARKNYEGALLRYKDADQEKPEDAAIHVRLGRVFEKLNQTPEAIHEYKAAEQLAAPEKWSDEAKAALLRLQHRPTLKH